ncbi:MAG: hypothetical protein ABI882_08895 [Acidobacteriota bacterium]
MSTIDAKSKRDKSVLQTFLETLGNENGEARAAAILAAQGIGADAVLPLAKMIGGHNLAAAKAASEALKRIVHHAARPGTAAEAKAVSTHLLQLATSDQPVAVRREASHLLGYVALEHQAERIASLLRDPVLREDVRQTLQRIPGRKVDTVLEDALRTAPPEFAVAIKLTLQHRSGVRDKK